jgi:hypothetical protein
MYNLFFERFLNPDRVITILISILMMKVEAV